MEMMKNSVAESRRKLKQNAKNSESQVLANKIFKSVKHNFD